LIPDYLIGDNVNFAHIFKVKGGWQVIISASPCLRGGDSVVAEVTFTSKVDAKRYAKSTGAKAWNF
jgi:acyl-coenzyme A thioesterase PaaI-like protein